MRAIISIALALTCAAAIADDPKPAAPAASGNMNWTADSSKVTADSSKATADGGTKAVAKKPSKKAKSKALTTQDGKPIVAKPSGEAIATQPTTH